MNKSVLVSGVSLLSVAALAVPLISSAHVAVSPKTAGIGAFQTFSVGVPSELDQPTVALRLLLPKGLDEVTPNVKAGWNIEVKKDGTGDDAEATEIDWSGGSIPAGDRDDLAFSAQVPAKATTLNWVAYQTYADGTVVSWDATPGTAEKEGVQGPYSQTMVINDLTPTPAKSGLEQAEPYVGPIALALSVVALYLSFRKRN